MERLGEVRRVAEYGNPKWQKGVSGNPSGRPKKDRVVALLVSAKTKQGEELVDFLLSVMRGQIEGTTTDKLHACKMLLDRGWGKAPESIEHTMTVTLAHLVEESMSMDRQKIPHEILS